MSDINELIEQIGGRERMEAMAANILECHAIAHSDVKAMARALLVVLDARPDFYIHRVERCDSYGPEVELRVFNSQLDASKCRDDHGGEIIEAYTTPPADSVPDGWKLVPVEPTIEMISAAREWAYGEYSRPVGNDAAKGFWVALTAAAPAPGGH